MSWLKIDAIADAYRAVESRGEAAIVDDADNQILHEHPTVTRCGE
jgi:hypothetical protein